MAVAELPRELVVAIARRARHGVVLTTMLQVCRAWRVALTAEIASLWREAALEQYPRLREILGFFKTQSPCFRTLYRNQLEAENKARSGANHPPDPELDQYVLTVELSWAAEWRLDDQGNRVRDGWTYVAGESCRLGDAIPFGDHDPAQTGNIPLYKEAAYDALIPSNYTAAQISDRVRVTIHVTRVSDMKSIQLAVADDIINLHELIGGDNEIRFVEATLPRIPQVFGDSGTNYDSRPAVEMEFAPNVMEVRLHFSEQPHHDLDVEEPLMLVGHLKRYLAWHADW